jgi:endonuclease/exonuclease/phosphatase family metal-dependent hydrolase
VITYNLKMIWCFPEYNPDCTPKKSRAEAFDGFDDVPFTELALGSWVDDPTMFRARRIAERLSEADADVVVLTEAAQDAPVDKIIEPTLSETYPHRTALDRPFRPLYYYEGGIVIFSKHPIDASDTTVLNPRKPDSARGAVHAELSVEGQSYDMFGVHLWPDVCPGSGSCTCKQKKEAHWEPHQRPRLRELESYVADREDDATPSIIAGDFNIGTGLHKCGRHDRSRFETMLGVLDAVEIAHPRPTIGRPDGRILDHILIRHATLSSSSTAETLTYKSDRKETGIGDSGRKLSDHHPVRAELHFCDVPPVESVGTKSPSDADKPVLEVRLAEDVRCPGLEVVWEVAPTPEFDDVTFEETEKFRRKQPQTLRQNVPAEALETTERHYWRVRVGVGLETHSDFGTHTHDGLWAPSDYDKPVRFSGIQSLGPATAEAEPAQEKAARNGR